MIAIIAMSIIAFIGLILEIVIGTEKQNDSYYRYGNSPPPPVQYSGKIIAVDFDGTLVDNMFPEIGVIKKDIVDRVKYAKRQGAVIILWTCRSGKELEQAIKFLERNQVPIDYINENPLNPYGDTNRKIYADEYWDDKAVKIY